MTNALLDTLALPHFGDIRPDQIAPALDQVLADHRAVVAKIVATRPTDFADAWLPLERAETAIASVWSAVSHLQGVADTPELRAAYGAGQVRLVENQLQVMQNLDRDRFRDISVELSALSNAFGSAVLDATESWSEHVTDAALLDGVSDADRTMFAAAAKDKGLDGWLVTLQQPSVNAILTFATNRDLRARVYRASATRASDQGPDAGKFDNSPRIARILELRHEAARLLGFADPVEWSLATKMAPNAGEVLAFLRDLARRAKPAAERDLGELRAFAAAELGIADLQPWDVGFASNKLRQSRYAVDEQLVRAYFPVERVVAGWQALLTRLFGVTLVERHDVSLYHPDARYLT
jgi:oligopeptidase A